MTFILGDEGLSNLDIITIAIIIMFWLFPIEERLVIAKKTLKRHFPNKEIWDCVLLRKERRESQLVGINMEGDGRQQSDESFQFSQKEGERGLLSVSLSVV